MVSPLQGPFLVTDHMSLPKGGRGGENISAVSTRLVTRKHSSRMRTAHLPTVFCGIPGSMSQRAVGTRPPPGHTHSPMDIPAHPHHLPAHPTTYPPLDTCESITFRQLRLRAVKISNEIIGMQGTLWTYYLFS